MGCIVISERDVVPKGLSKKVPDEKKILEYVYEDDYRNLDLLEQIMHLEKPTLFYPGCGADVIFPLEYAQRLFSPKELRCVFVDKEYVLRQILTILDDVGVSFTKDFRFYWKGMLVKLEFHQADVFKIISAQSFDIYFERAFRIMKGAYHNYESYVFQQLNNNGFIISDSGFQNVPLQKLNVSQELSSYKEMIIGKKG